MSGCINIHRPRMFLNTHNPIMCIKMHHPSMCIEIHRRSAPACASTCIEIPSQFLNQYAPIFGTNLWIHIHRNSRLTIHPLCVDQRAREFYSTHISYQLPLYPTNLAQQYPLDNSHFLLPAYCNQCTFAWNALFFTIQSLSFSNVHMHIQLCPVFHSFDVIRSHSVDCFEKLCFKGIRRLWST